MTKFASFGMIFMGCLMIIMGFVSFYCAIWADGDMILRFLGQGVLFGFSGLIIGSIGVAWSD